MQKLMIPYGEHPSQYGILRLPEGTGPFPVAVMIHGGNWQMMYGLECIELAAQDLAKRGLATWNIEYRRVGERGGGWPGTFVDAAAAVRFLRPLAKKYPLDLKRDVLLGHSAGGQLALWLSSRSRLAGPDALGEPLGLELLGCVGLAAVSDLRRLWELDQALETSLAEDLLGGSPEAYPERYQLASPLELLPMPVPQVLFHGEDDMDIPPDFSAAYCRKAAGLGMKAALRLLPGMDHFLLVEPAGRSWEEICQAVRQLTGA